MSAGGLLAILTAALAYDAMTRFPGPSALLPCIGAAAFIAANDGRMTSTGRLLSTRPIVFIGLISYSLYLWHWPAIAFINRVLPGQLDVVSSLSILVASLVVATLSWWLIERPFRRRTLLSNRRSVLQLGEISAIVALMLGGLIDATNGFTGRVPDAVLELAEQERNPKYRQPTTLEQLETGQLLQLGPAAEDATQVRFVLWGDSHAMAIAPEIDQLSLQHGVSGLASLRGGTPPMLGVWVDHPKIGRRPLAYNRAVVDFVVEHDIRNVIVAGRWHKYLFGDDGDPLEGIVVGEKATRATSLGARQAFEQAIRGTVRALNAAGVHVFLLRQVPDHRVDIPRELADRLWREMHLEGIGISRLDYERDQQTIGTIFNRLETSGVTIIDPSELLFDADGQPILMQGGQSLYLDEDHVSDAGAHFLRPVIEPLIQAIKAQGNW